MRIGVYLLSRFQRGFGQRSQLCSGRDADRHSRILPALVEANKIAAFWGSPNERGFQASCIHDVGFVEKKSAPPREGVWDGAGGRIRSEGVEPSRAGLEVPLPIRFGVERVYSQLALKELVSQ